MLTEQVDRVLHNAVTAGDVAGVVGVAADRSGTILESAAGVRAAGADDLMTVDTVFRIASMTKLVTMIATLQLVERHQLDLDAPVETILPAFERLQVLVGFDGDRPRLRAPIGRATVRQLLTHTSGLAYFVWNGDVDRWYAVTDTPGILSGLAAALDAPLVADPGTRFEYGISYDWLGRVIEVVSGQPLDIFWAANIFEPLGLHDTTVSLSSEQQTRQVAVHVRMPDGRLHPIELARNEHPEFWAGGHCLLSTPRDYLVLLRMLLAGGAVGAARILDQATVSQIFTNQIGDLGFPPSMPTAHPELAADFNVGPGYTYGLGLLVNTRHDSGMRATGSGAWAGSLNTHYWIDPATGVAAGLFTQTLPFADPRIMQLYVDFERAVYRSLEAATRPDGPPSDSV